MTTTSSIRIDLDALEGNLEAIARLVGGGNPASDRICAVVKSDAYGLGAARIAGSMASMGIRNFAAYQPQEAVEVLQRLKAFQVEARRDRAERAERAKAEGSPGGVDASPASASPLVELLQSSHGELCSKLFNS